MKQGKPKMMMAGKAPAKKMPPWMKGKAPAGDMAPGKPGMKPFSKGGKVGKGKC